MLAAIGHLLTESGLHDVLVIVYASNVVIRILRGKDIIARALQGHLLVCFVEDLWKMTPYLSAVDSMTQPLNEIGKSLYAKGGSSGRRTSQLHRHYL